MSDTLPRHKDVWSFIHAGLGIEIILHSQGEMVNGGKGIWCFYIFIREDKCNELGFDFESLWLEDKIVKYTPVSPEKVTHDYEGLLPDSRWHGGITFYDKHGHSKGHRCVQIGCDFAHYGDEDQGYQLDDIVAEAKKTADQVLAQLKGNKQ